MNNPRAMPNDNQKSRPPKSSAQTSAPNIGRAHSGAPCKRSVPIRVVFIPALKAAGIGQRLSIFYFDVNADVGFRP
jgi:hypothetical protein